MTSPRVALAHDYLTQRGGAERVVLAMARAFPGAELYTSLYYPEATYPELAGLTVHQSDLVRVRLLQKRHRLGVPFYPWAFGRMRPDADVVLCSSSGWAHGIGGDAPRIVYCHTPARWLYRPDDFAPSAAARLGIGVLGPHLRRWDQAQARSATRYLTNAPNIAARIADVYGIEAEVLPPPLSLDPSGPQRPVPGVGRGFVLCVARLLPYKHVDLVCAAAALLPEVEFVVVGSGPERERLLELAPRNVRFVSVVDDDELRWLYSNAAVLAAPAEEDYGLTPGEAAAFGVPTVARRAGGHVVTVVEGQTGLLLASPTPASFADGLRAALSASWASAPLLAHASDLSGSAFARRLREVVAEVWSG
jgi:glycosyltransferase involved in cell wall biosynthesis